MPRKLGDISIMSYNVLLPNSQDGWWLYKMYSQLVPVESTTWNFRQRLLQDQIAVADADVVCLQEAAESSFESDFHFMKDLG